MKYNKRGILILTMTLLLNACSSSNRDVIEGETKLEIAACKLVKEYVAFQAPSDYRFDFDQIECDFQGDNGSAFLINIKPTSKNPIYEDYMKLPENSQTMTSQVVSNPIESTIIDNNLKPGPTGLGQLFIKDGDEFRNQI